MQRFASGNGRKCGRSSRIYFIAVHEFSPQDKKRSKTRSERFSQVVGYLTLGIAAKVPSFVSTYQVLNGFFLFGNGLFMLVVPSAWYQK